jgi:hypothetical protein
LYNDLYDVDFKIPKVPARFCDLDDEKGEKRGILIPADLTATKGIR